MKSRLAKTETEYPNDRGISVFFGWSILKAFLEKNQLKTLIRAHEQKDDGFKLHMWAGEDEDPPCITIFSAPNYCQHKNPGSILVTEHQGEKARILTYDQYKHNYFLRL